MPTKIFHEITPEVRDQTGLYLCGRHADGRYQYRSESVLGDGNVVTLTHEERVGLAVCYALAKLMRPGVTTSIYVMTKTRGRPRLWLMKPDLGAMGRAYLAGAEPQATSTLAHEMGHNTQRRGSKPHGPEFDAAHLQMRLAMQRALAKGWPKLDMRRLRDSVAPHLTKKVAKKQRRDAAASESRVARWTRTLANAEKLLAVWRKKLAAAERKVAAWEKKVKHAQTHLARATRDETP